MKRISIAGFGLLFIIACGNLQPSQTGSITQANVSHCNVAAHMADVMATPTEPITFKVDDVEKATAPMLTADAKKIFENKTGSEILYMPDEHLGQNFVPAGNNAFIQTIQDAYDEHRPLRLSPDAIWLTICQGVAIHINEKFDSLESIIFKANKPKELVVRNDSLENGGKEWANLIASLSSETSQYVNKEYHSFFVPRFSTTTLTVKTAYEVTMMHAFKDAFYYVGESGCGIPSITLTGNKQDWEIIHDKLAMLTHLGLHDWRTELEPIIDEFINVYDGTINTEFWNGIYKNMIDYNAYYISGWILKFFPYLESGEWADKNYERKRITYTRNPFLKGDTYLLSTLSTGDFPSGVLDVNITWNNYLHGLPVTEKMTVYAGFFAMKQYDDLTLEPVISWAICSETAKEVEHELPRNLNAEMTHDHNDYWTPDPAKIVTSKPVFMPEKFDDYETGNSHLIKMLKDSLQANFNYADIIGKKLSFIALSNSNVEQVIFDSNTEVQTYLNKLLKSFNGQWFPALAMSDEVFFMWENLYNTEPVKIKVNYKIEIVFD